jgi:LacI family transcriptional regulator
MATVRDVATRAGVSVATVSRVINETSPVSDKLSARVLAAVDELGYQPNRLARSLRRGETQTLGLIVPNIADPFFAEMARCVENAGTERGYSVIVCSADHNVERELFYVRLLSERQVDGILFVAAQLGKEQTRGVLNQGVPVVVVDRAMPGLGVDSVLVDNLCGGWLATRHLIELGHHRIACITTSLDTGPFVERYEGYRRALDESGLPVIETLVVRSPQAYDMHERGYEAACNLLSASELPTALFVCNDLMAIGALNAAADRGFQVPGDVSVVGYDDIYVASLVRPALTTIAQPVAETGALATSMLLERVRDPDLPPRNVVLEARLVLRGSTARVRDSAGEGTSDGSIA